MLKNLFVLAAFAALLGAPSAVSAQSSMMMSGSAMAPHAYDWMLGTWTCTNTIPTALSGPATQKLVATRSIMPGVIVWRYTAANFDQYGFISYNAKTKTWWSSWAYPSGTTGNESSKQGGTKSMWAGMIYDVSGKPFAIRDTYTVYSATKFNDVGEDQSNGTWKPGYNGTCTKS
jgi:hypothetical protein